MNPEFHLWMKQVIHIHIMFVQEMCTLIVCHLAQPARWTKSSTNIHEQIAQFSEHSLLHTCIQIDVLPK